MSKPAFFVFVGLFTIGMLCPSAGAVSSTDQVARKGEPVDARMAEIMGWPEGVMDVINDPARTDGWNPWFSEWPNDVNHFEYHFKEPTDLDRVIGTLAAVKTTPVRIVLSTKTEPRSLGFSTVLKEGNGASGLFSIGSQKRLDQWFKELPDGQFGVHHLTEAPQALPPTLTLYVANPTIDLTQLRVPTVIKVVAEPLRADPEPDAQVDPLYEQIKAFVRDHEARQADEAEHDEQSEESEQSPQTDSE